MKEFHCKVVSCDKTFYDGPCLSVVIPGFDGELGFLADHAPCVAALTDGTIRIKTPEEKTVFGVCSTGMLRFRNNTATILVDTIERPEDIDVVRAREAKERAEEDMREAQSLADFKASQAALARALHRLSAHGKYVDHEF